MTDSPTQQQWEEGNIKDGNVESQDKNGWTFHKKMGEKDYIHNDKNIRSM